MTHPKEELLKKLKALADRGIDGEKANAQNFLNTLMQKYGITEAELGTDKKEDVFFVYHDEIEMRLLDQCIYKVTGRASFGCVGASSGRTRKKRGIDCTLSEQLEIEVNYEFYKKAIKEELDVFFTAFCFKNDLFPDENIVPAKDMNSISPEEKAKFAKAGLMAESIEKHTLHKLIEE